MSQIYKNASSGPPPPGSLISLTTDDGTIVSPNVAGTIFVHDTGLNTIGNISSNSITINSFFWTVTASTSFTPANYTGYILLGTSKATITLPVSPPLNYWFAIMDQSGHTYVIAQNAGDSLELGTQISTTGTAGSVTSTKKGDTCSYVCWAAGPGASWIGIWPLGNFEVI
jgi:hypothetical protein